MTPIKWDELLHQWSRQSWKPHYLFTGQEDFLIDQAVEEASRHWRGEHPDPLSLEHLDAETNSVHEILQAARTVPFFGGQRVLQIQNASQFTIKEQEEIA